MKLKINIGANASLDNNQIRIKPTTTDANTAIVEAKFNGKTRKTVSIDTHLMYHEQIRQDRMFQHERNLVKNGGSGIIEGGSLSLPLSYYDSSGVAVVTPDFSIWEQRRVDTITAPFGYDRYAKAGGYLDPIVEDLVIAKGDNTNGGTPFAVFKVKSSNNTVGDWDAIIRPKANVHSSFREIWVRPIDPVKIHCTYLDGVKKPAYGYAYNRHRNKNFALLDQPKWYKVQAVEENEIGYVLQDWVRSGPGKEFYIALPRAHSHVHNYGYVI